MQSSPSESDTPPYVVWRCGECGTTASSVKLLHLHIDSVHIGVFDWLNPLHSDTLTLTRLTEADAVEDWPDVDLEEVGER